jgi:hypothetical protein
MSKVGATLLAVSLTSCGVPPTVLYQAASGAAVLCEVIAGVVRNCREVEHPPRQKAAP